ncbi:MAG TPA: GNAT family protein [Flavobacteriales bacterium]|nr:GNAT family protein [Flavobacteriales bacterium]
MTYSFDQSSGGETTPLEPSPKTLGYLRPHHIFKMNISGKTVTLRAIESRDLEQLQAWANDPDIQSGLGGWHFPISQSDQQKWYESLHASSPHQRFAVETGSLGLVGTANLVDIDWKNRHAFHGLMIGHPDARGKGIGIDAVMAIMRYAFDELGLRRLDGTMIAYNEASLRLYIGKCGWVEEGRQRDWYYRKGRYWDRIMVGITEQDYRSLLLRTPYWEKS